MGKCEWKDVDNMMGGGHNKVFSPCDDFEPKNDSVGIFCRGCKETINKPIPEPQQPIIKKDGGTWVKRDRGIDYLFLGFNGEEIPHPENAGWKPISEIKITDDIAKLRPMVMIEASENTYGLDEGLQILTFIDDKVATFRHMVCGISSIKTLRLATVTDLED